MSAVIADPVELRARGFGVLVAQLGWVNAVRFIQQYERGMGDYTRERQELLPDWDARALLEEVEKHRR